MRCRPASRLLLLDPDGRVLLFRFVHTDDALAGRAYWATPGGAVKAGETFAQAAIRELAEETGLRVEDVGGQVGCRRFVLPMPSGERVIADERFFVVRVADKVVCRDGWTAHERDVMAAHRWWSRDELAHTPELIYPEDLLDLLRAAEANHDDRSQTTAVSSSARRSARETDARNAAVIGILRGAANMARPESNRSGDEAGELSWRRGAGDAGSEQVILEGFHALKHALRFGAQVADVAAVDPQAVLQLARDLAPDLSAVLETRLRRIDPGRLNEVAGRPVATGVIALAQRPAVDAEALLRTAGGRIVLLDHPRHLGNLGAVVRVAAAAGAAGVLTTGTQDPWHPAALRGSAGLHFALPVARIEALPETGRPLIAVDPAGDPVTPEHLPDGAVLAFGSERRGLSKALLVRADRRVAIPMRRGVSSLNLATAVAIVLYAGDLALPGSAGDEAVTGAEPE